MISLFSPPGCLLEEKELFCNIHEKKNILPYVFFIPLAVLEDQYNPRLVKELLSDLSSTLHDLYIHVGRSVLVGNINIWKCRLETILKWQQQLNNLQIPKVEDVSVFLCTCM